MNTVQRLMKSQDMRLQNANKHKLSAAARQIYLQGIASLSKCEEVAAKGNLGKGFTLVTTVLERREPKQTR